MTCRLCGAAWRQLRAALLALVAIAMTGDLTLAQFFPEAEPTNAEVVFGSALRSRSSSPFITPAQVRPKRSRSRSRASAAWKTRSFCSW